VTAPMHAHSTKATGRPSRLFYGWHVTYALLIISTMTSGFLFYNISVLLDAFVAQRGFPVSVASASTGAFFLSQAIAGALVGQIIGRVDAQKIIVVSAIVTAITLSAIALITATWQLYIFYIVLGFCYGGCGLVTASTIVARWFETKRPQALSVASTGLSLGGIVITPLSAYFIKEAGLNVAGPWLGAAFALGVVPITLLVVRAHPRDLGLLPYGTPPLHGNDENTHLAGIKFSEAWRTHYFAAITLCYLFSLGAQVGAIAHLFRLINTRSDARTAAIALAILAATSLLGRLAAGQILSKIHARAFTVGAMVWQAASLAFLAFAQESQLLLVGAFLFGICIGTILMMQQLLLAEAFGSRDYGQIYSVSQLVTVIGVAGGPALLGLLFDASGGYRLPYLVTAASTALGAAILAFVGNAKRIDG
jgi:MFS family permease